MTQDQLFVIEVLKLIVPILSSVVTIFTYRKVTDVHHQMNSMKDELVKAEKGKSFLEGREEGRIS